MLDINVKNEQLYDALLSLTELILDLAVNKIPSNAPVTMENIWEKQNDSAYVKHPVKKILWVFVLHNLESEIKEKEEYINLINILESDDVISKQLNTLVGSVKGGSRLEGKTIAFFPANKFLLGQGAIAFSLSMFNSIYSAMEKSLYSDKVEYEHITPLCGFNSDLTDMPLDENVSIVRMSEDEIIEVLSLGINLGKGFGNTGFIHGIHQYALKIKYRLDKVIGDSKPNLGELEGDKYLNGTYEKSIVDALRIYKAGRLYPITTIGRSKAIFSFGTSFSFEVPVKPFMNNKFVFSNDDFEGFKNFWNERKQAKLPDRNFLTVAMRRFSQSNERDSIEDRIIDLMISAESIFLGSENGVSGELQYRLSHRAAMFIADDTENQRYIFKFMKDAYKVRSSIVHGSTPKLPKKADGSECTLEGFCDEIEKYLRISIKKSLAQVINTESSVNFIDWDSVIFPESK